VVLNITSISARRPSPGTAVYGAAKAALESLTGSLAVEWAPRIRVNAVSCGLVATPGSLEHYGDAEQIARVAATIPRGAFATPQEIGAACLLLASPLASHVTGAVLDVDGGGEWPAFLQHTPNA
jgi:NAD(P)-dependent dehydrogenase (short-subunit alcohol dehydrogenase family)